MIRPSAPSLALASAVALSLAFGVSAGAAPTETTAPATTARPPPSRGELLYTTHCIACHATQMHWRDKRLAVDWPSLVGQVRRFQGVAQLQWTEEDIREVARHLNDTIYRFAPPPRG